MMEKFIFAGAENLKKNPIVTDRIAKNDRHLQALTVDQKLKLNKSARIKKLLLILAGSLSFALGIIGILVPLLPTTPFLLLAAACYMRSSERLYNWLIYHRVFGKVIRDYIQKRTISLKVKISSLTLMWLVISYSALFLATKIWISLMLFAIATGVTIHIISFKTGR